MSKTKKTVKEAGKIATKLVDINNDKLAELRREVAFYIGVSERNNTIFKGNNNISGEEFVQRLLKTGWRRGQYWCAFFAEMIWTKIFPYIPSKYYSGNSQKTLQLMKSCPDVYFSEIPIVGSIVVYKYSGTSGHTDCFVTKVVDNDTFYAIGGNVNDSVKETKRNRKKTGRTLLGFIIPKELLKEVQNDK